MQIDDHPEPQYMSQLLFCILTFEIYILLKSNSNYVNVALPYICY